MCFTAIEREYAKSEFRVIWGKKLSFKPSLINTVGNSPPISLVKKCISEFLGQIQVTPNVLYSQLRSLGPKQVKTMHNKVLTDRRSRIREIAKVIDLSYGSVVPILNVYLDMALFNPNPEKLLLQLVTLDELWIHHNKTKTKKQ